MTVYRFRHMHAWTDLLDSRHNVMGSEMSQRWGLTRFLYLVF